LLAVNARVINGEDFARDWRDRSESDASGRR
jgi:hypothetical protein